jgi:signal transduction histidine kinase
MQQKILLVDDREDNLLSLETILEPDGYKFVKAGSGRQALKILLKEYDFALILMDVKMPNLNGFETASLIYEREKLKHIPIIFITANNYGEENIFKGYKSGAVDYIYKPVNSDLLRAKVNVFIDLYRKTQKLKSQEQKLIAINKSLENEISERKASEKKIKELNRQLLENIDRLESANKDLDQFAFMASHDLQEPLRKIRTFSDRLLLRSSEALDNDGKMCLSRIQNASARMQTLINDILDFSRISGEEYLTESVNLNMLLEDLKIEMESQIREKEASILTEELPTINANARLIRVLFQNLLSNSLKYSQANVSPVIRIRADIVEKVNGNELNYCRIYVSDNGIGFDQKYAEQIFGMFKRLHLNTEYEGTGIGLALCKKIVEKHHGFISANSKPNGGSTFIVSLPIQQVDLPASIVAVNNLSSEASHQD